MEYFERLVSKIDAYRVLGFKTLQNGVVLVGHIPHIAPEAYLHTLYPRLSTSEIDTLERIVGSAIPAEFILFLQRTNGADLFLSSLAIHGLRKSYTRSGDDARQPYALELINVQERPRKAKASYFFVGTYRLDGSLVFMDTVDQQVFHCSKSCGKIRGTWPNFGAMIEAEFDRLAALDIPPGSLLVPRT
jgi:hypothetical protein